MARVVIVRHGTVLARRPLDCINAKAAGYPRIAAGSGVASLMLVAVVVLMVWKP
ncbi:hypothetical protein [Cryobacterium breve]|uniref:hypothetical protein n=1 Tax=Cryobacterium breve TaxID=1259258 RepID=UPI00248C3A00|nr:hypothetical protein [Cryobacterium breve]